MLFVLGVPIACCQLGFTSPSFPRRVPSPYLPLIPVPGQFDGSAIFVLKKYTFSSLPNNGHSLRRIEFRPPLLSRRTARLRLFPLRET